MKRMEMAIWRARCARQVAASFAARFADGDEGTTGGDGGGGDGKEKKEPEIVTPEQVKRLKANIKSEYEGKIQAVKGEYETKMKEQETRFEAKLEEALAQVRGEGKKGEKGEKGDGDGKSGAEAILLKTQIEAMQKKLDASENSRIATERRQVEDAAHGALSTFIAQLPLASNEAENVEALHDILFKKLVKDSDGNFVRDEKGGFLMRSPKGQDGTTFDEAISLDMVKINTPKLYLAAAGAAGSGGHSQGGTRGVVTASKDAEIVLSQEAYENMTPAQRYAASRRMSGGVQLPAGATMRTTKTQETTTTK